jgi:DNA-directed RNA polymerase subunit RPC12/RpoP
MSVKCLCWKCGREIQDTEEIFEINEELWCEDCASPRRWRAGQRL